ncbi:hypothetical protein [Streptomyces sp. NBC_01361]|uniref:hypothetical protein n=1 Tax=Streptomyces sp. NBC_01361 TaxID=2903838 RepID=UPI002E348694|nr:hypothetical protein [Streptomyces sp. NBC_01361]
MVSDTVAVGVLTFTGTVLATLTGLWQWRRVQAREQRAEFRVQRVEALRAVWEALSDLEEAQRSSILVVEYDAQDATERLAQVNLLLLRRSPFLRPDEQEWATAFARHVTEIDTVLRTQMEAGRPDASWWITSAIQPASSHVASVAAQQLRNLRTTLGDRYAAVVRGDSE